MTMNVGHIHISHFDYGGKLLFTNFFKVKIISSPALYITDRREHLFTDTRPRLGLDTIAVCALLCFLLVCGRHNCRVSLKNGGF